MRWAAILLVVGCYRPTSRESCKSACAALDQRCPNEQTCGPDLMCHDSNGPACSDGGVAPPGTCFGHALTDFECQVLPEVPDTIELPTTIDTRTFTCTQFAMQNRGQQVCVIAAHRITIDAPTRVIGKYPVALIAIDTLTISPGATLDVSSFLSANGAGVDNDGCTASPGGGPLGNAWGAGGGGGAFGGGGGAGGSTGNATMGTRAKGGAQTDPMATPTLVRGGCAGGVGGGGDGIRVGQAGGGVYLIAGDTIDIAGGVYADGTGGDANPIMAGANGGGSGGMIALEAPHIVVESTGEVCATAGGGGAGNGTTASAAGGDGVRCGAGIGGEANVDGGGGGGDGYGAASTVLHGGDAGSVPSTGMGAGGGGGGGAGYILLFGQAQVDGTIAPAP